MRDKIIEVLNSSSKMSLNALEKVLGTKGLNKTLDELRKEGIITLNRNKEYVLCSFLHLYPCLVVNVSRNGIEVLNLIDKLSKYQIDNTRAFIAIMGDVVLCGFHRSTCYVHEIIKETEDSITGIVKQGHKTKYVEPFSYNYPLIDIDSDVEIGSVVSVKIIERSPFIKGVLDEYIADKYDTVSKIKAIAKDHKVNLKFSDDVLENAKSLLDENIEDEFSYRKDLTDHLICTIDGSDAKDLDDAIEVSKKDNLYNLKVHIADVSHYVRKYSYIDKEALKRGTSIYLPNYVIPMLPEVLCNNLCSLNPNEIKLTMTCDMDIDKEGNIVNYDIYESYIKSSYRLNYDDVNKYFDGNLKYDEKLNKMLDIGLELSNILKKNKIKRGEVELAVLEPIIECDELGNVLDVRVRKSGKAERLIEDFMIAANETVASHIYYQEKPFIYRIHEKPSSSKFEEFENTVHSFGYKIIMHKDELYPSSYQTLLDSIKDENIKKVISLLMLRSMSKAKYSLKNLGHFGLASTCYTHFTSPIRRYPDLLVHRLLKMYIHNNKYNEEALNEEIKHIADLSSDNEVKAIELERKVDDIKMAEFMSNKIGDKFSGYINSVVEYGMYITLDNLVEGLARFRDIKDDFYIFDEKNNQAIGSSKHNVFKIGQKVQVKVINVNINNGNIDFEIEGDSNGTK